jgi:hypothetical protein
MGCKRNTATNGTTKGKSLESWIWDAVCSMLAQAELICAARV